MEGGIQVIGLAFILFVLGTAIVKMIFGYRQPAGRSVGRNTGWLRSPTFYILASVIFFGICALLWQPLPVAISLPWRAILLAAGGVLLLGGLGLYAWGMASLGRMFSGSTSLGVQLYAHHRLITVGPYKYIRHPMYLGIMVAAFGGLFLYHNVTMLLVALGFLGLPLRARREEMALSAEFGQEWQDYRNKVPAFFPALLKKSPSTVSKHVQK